MSTRAWLAGFALLLVSVASHANIVAGKDYTVITPAQNTDSPGKTEVIEFFSYGCPHCYEFHGALDSWAAKLPRDVVLKRVAVGFGNKTWANLAKAYYALQSMGDAARLDTALFDALHKERLPLTDERSITDWVSQHGVDRARFTAAYNSFGVTTRVMETEQMVRRYQVSGIPMLVVGGQFVPQGRTFDEMLSITSQLVTKAKTEGLAKK